MIFRGEVVAQQTHRREVDLAPLDQREYDRKPTSDARRGQPMKSLALAQAESPHAVVNHDIMPRIFVSRESATRGIHFSERKS
jgi:hypothetical protein